MARNRGRTLAQGFEELLRLLSCILQDCDVNLKSTWIGETIEHASLILNLFTRDCGNIIYRQEYEVLNHLHDSGLSKFLADRVAEGCNAAGEFYDEVTIHGIDLERPE